MVCSDHWPVWCRLRKEEVSLLPPTVGGTAKQRKSLEGWRPTTDAAAVAWKNAVYDDVKKEGNQVAGVGRPLLERLEQAVWKRAVSTPDCLSAVEAKWRTKRAEPEAALLRARWKMAPRDSREKREAGAKWKKFCRTEKRKQAEDRLLRSRKRAAAPIVVTTWKAKPDDDDLILQTKPQVEAIRNQLQERFTDPMETKAVTRARLELLETWFRGLPLDRRRLNVSLTHVLKALAGLSVGTAPGNDGIVPEMLKELPWMIKWELAKAIHETVNSDKPYRTLEGWRVAILFALAKVPSPTHVDDLRLIALTSTLQKAWMSALLEAEGPAPGAARRTWSDEAVLTAGFLPRCGCGAVVFALQGLLRRAWKWKNVDKMWLLSADVEKAFDNIGHAALMHTLMESKASGPLVRAILNEWSENRAEVSVGQLARGKIDYSKGGGQGKKETPRMWTLLLEAALQPLVKSWANCGRGLCLPG